MARGGLRVQNRLRIDSKKENREEQEYLEEISRDEIKKYLYKCFKEDTELSEMHEKIKKAGIALSRQKEPA